MRVDDYSWEEAKKAYDHVIGARKTGRERPTKESGLTVADLCNHFRYSKLRQKEAGELSARMYEEYVLTGDMIVARFGGSRFVFDLAADDFAALREDMMNRWGPHRITKGVTRRRCSSRDPKPGS